MLAHFFHTVPAVVKFTKVGFHFPKGFVSGMGLDLFEEFGIVGGDSYNYAVVDEADFVVNFFLHFFHHGMFFSEFFFKLFAVSPVAFFPVEGTDHRSGKQDAHNHKSE